MINGGRIKLAIIGYGHMGHIYKHVCNELIMKKRYEPYYKYGLNKLLDNLQLTAIVDPLLKKAFSKDLYYFSSINELLDSSDVSVNTAIIASPIKTHFDLARQLIYRNINLLIEKPVCTTENEIKKLMILAKENNVKIMPGHVERYNPVTLEAMEAKKYLAYGNVKSYQLIRTGHKPERVKDNLIIDKLVHDLDLVSCIFGEYKILDVKTKWEENEIMECSVALQHEGNYKGEIISSWAIEKKERSIKIYFEKANLFGNFLKKTLNIERLEEISKKIVCYQNNQIKDQLADFVGYINMPIKTVVKMKDSLISAVSIDKINRIIGDEYENWCNY